MPLLRRSGREQEDPNRLAGDQQRGQAGGNLLFRPMQRAVPDEKEEDPDDEAGADLRPGGAQTFGQAPEKKDRTRGEVPNSGRVERRNGFNGIANGQIRGSPNQVNGKKAKDDGEAVWLRESPRRNISGSLFNNEGSLVRRHL